MRLEGWPRATSVQAAILRDASLRPRGERLLLRMRSECFEMMGFVFGRSICPDFACRTARCRAGSSAFNKFRDHAILQVICPTCQIVFARPRLPAAARLLCMGSFSIFWFGARASRAAACLVGIVWHPTASRGIACSRADPHGQPCARPARQIRFALHGLEGYIAA